MCHLPEVARQLFKPLPLLYKTDATFRLHSSFNRALAYCARVTPHVFMVTVFQLLFICRLPRSRVPLCRTTERLAGLHRDSRYMIGPKILGGRPWAFSCLWYCGQSLTGAAVARAGTANVHSSNGNKSILGMVLAFRRVLKTLANRATDVGAMPANPYGLGKLRHAASNLVASAAISFDSSI